jgi:hypothetical protein
MSPLSNTFESCYPDNPLLIEVVSEEMSLEPSDILHLSNSWFRIDMLDLLLIDDRDLDLLVIFLK